MDHVSPPQSPYSEKPGLSTGKKIAIAAIVGLVGIAIMSGYTVLKFIQSVTYSVSYTDNAMEDIAYQFDTISTTTVEDDVYTSLGKDPIYGEYLKYEGDSIRVFTELFPEEYIDIEWQQGATPVIDSASFMKKIDPGYPSSIQTSDLLMGEVCDTCQVYLFVVGKVRFPERFHGATVYQVYVPYQGMGVNHGRTLALFSEETNQFIALEANNVLYNSVALYAFPETLRWFAGKAKVNLDDIFAYKESIDIREPYNITVYHDRIYPGLTDEGVLRAWWADGQSGIESPTEQKVLGITAQDRIISHDEEYGPIYYNGRYFFIVLADGTQHIYDIRPDFFVEDTPEEAEKGMYSVGKKTTISWSLKNNSYTSDTRFIEGGTLGPFGCGRNYIPLTSVVSDEPWFHESLLRQIGTTASGDGVYEMINQDDNLYYQELYEYGYANALYVHNPNFNWNTDISLENKQMYEEFKQDHAVFFWKDPMGAWRVFHKASYQTLAECGKPVIYLYPEETLMANVQVAPNGGFTKTDPLYPSGGWNVIAHPNGVLEYPKNEQTYPYLFWEGHAHGFPFPEQGFVLKKEDVGTQMRELLYMAGLNTQEAEDFMEFWEERMTISPYVFVTFTDQRYFEEAAPLTVTPKPDTVIRVMMNFQPLDTWKDVEPLRMRTPERHGFTVVEWGGVLQ